MDKRKILWLMLLLAVFITLFIPCLVLAQGTKTELSLQLLPGNYFNDLVPGKDKTIFMGVTNTGNTTITNVRFSSDEPAGWIVSINPQTIDSLRAGDSRTVDVIIRAPGDTGNGDYTVNVYAIATETRTATSAFFHIQNTTSIWLWIGIAIVAMVIAAFIFIFLRSNKQ